MFVGVGGAWKRVLDMFVGVGGQHKRVLQGWVGVGGQWKTFYVGETITLSGTVSVPNFGTALASPPGQTVTWVFGSNGTVMRNGSPFNAGVEWNSAQPTPAGSYWIRGTHVQGDNPSGGFSLNTWHALTQDRQLTWASDGGPSENWVRIEIATDSSGNNVVATGYYGAEFVTP